jgi:hypothetical protein
MGHYLLKIDNPCLLCTRAIPNISLTAISNANLTAHFVGQLFLFHSHDAVLFDNLFLHLKATLNGGENCFAVENIGIKESYVGQKNNK